MIKKKYKIILLIIFTLIFSCKKEETKQQNNQAEYRVDFTIKGDSFSKNLNQTFGSTKSLFEIMMDLKSQNRLDFGYTGSKDTIFITEIDGIKNEGSRKQKRNWIFFVDGNLSEKGVSQVLIEKDTQILWCFTQWEEKEKCNNKIGGNDETNNKKN